MHPHTLTAKVGLADGEHAAPVNPRVIPGVDRPLTGGEMYDRMTVALAEAFNRVGWREIKTISSPHYCAGPE